MATDKIVAEYTVKVDKALKDLNKLAARVDKVDKERVKTQEGFKTMSEGMVSNFKKVGVAIGIAFGTQQIISFAKEAVTLAAKAEGIERAFAKLNNPNLLADLRKATRGTVTDLVLMQQAVRAQNFKVPLEQLAGFFKFATNRAIETGESVDYLVNSIIDGIGRKSSLVLDNLGISATELQEEIKKTGDFGEAAGNIIARELEKAGGVADTTATKIAQLNTEWENLQTVSGDYIVDFILRTAQMIGAVNEFQTKITALESTWNGMSLLGLSKQLWNDLTLLNKLEQEFKAFKDEGKGELSFKDFSKKQDELETEIRLQKEIVGALESQVGARKKLLEGAEDIEFFTPDQIEALTKVADEIIPDIIRNLPFLNKAIKDLTDERLTEDVTVARTKEINLELVALNEERAKLLANIRSKANDQQMQEIEALAITEVESIETATDDILADYEYRNGEILAAQEKLNAELESLEKEKTEQQLNTTLRYVAEIQNIANGLADLQFALNQQELANLKTQLDQEQITRDQYDVKRKELLNKQAEDDKQFAIFDAVINGAVAVVKAFSDGGPVLAALVAAGVALQVAAISATPTPQFAEGGWVDSKGLIHGRSHAGGGVKIEAEGNEYITSGKYAKPNAAILEAINTGNWEKYKMENIITPAINQVLDGGFENMGASYMLNNSFNDKNMLFATDRLRKSNRMDAKYIVSQLKPSSRKRGNYA